MPSDAAGRARTCYLLTAALALLGAARAKSERAGAGAQATSWCTSKKTEAGCTSQPGLHKCVWAHGKCSDAPKPKPTPPPPPSPPPSPSPEFDVAGFYLKLAPGAYTAVALNKSVAPGQAWGKPNDFSFVGGADNKVCTGCHLLGDVTLRVQPEGVADAAKGAMGSTWAIYDSAMAPASAWAHVRNVTGHRSGGKVLAAHDITALLDASTAHANYSNSYFRSVPLRVVRSWEASEDGSSLVMRFNITNTGHSALKVGGLGFAMPQAGQMHGIEESVWLDPHIGGDHGFVEWVRVVVDEQTMLATAEGEGSGLEAWRPIMEDCKGDNWEWTVHSEAWASEWAENKQFPYLKMADYLADARSAIDNTTMWAKPHLSPWPSWHGRETIPLTDFDGVAQRQQGKIDRRARWHSLFEFDMAAPWNAPTAITLEVSETRSYAIRLTLAPLGPRTRDTALLQAGRSALHAVPGYVLAPDMMSAKLFVRPPPGVSLVSFNISRPDILKAKRATTSVEVQYGAAATTAQEADALVTLEVKGLSRGRCRLTLIFSDGSVNQAHYSVLAPLATQIERVGTHWAEDAWLPRDYPDPFGRGASVMPYDRHDRTHVLDDSRAYDVGLSDDAGGGNPLGFAIKVAYAPTQFQVTRLDDYVRWTLYGVKNDTAKPPLKSLQIRPEDCIPELGSKNGSQCGNEDGIRMTMYYYGTDFNNSDGGYSGHWPYNYSEASKIGAAGIEGGPNWPMSETMANSTYRSFNFPHHVTTYLSLYYAARNTQLKTYRSWDWYLMRAANTTIKFGSPSVGVMDDTVFREILRALTEESVANATRTEFSKAARDIENNMYKRAKGFSSQPYPYGSEFAFDTTGQEAVVVLSYMRSSATWAYNGGSRSWGDLGNNGKWQATAGTNFETRGNFHYRSGLNAIPLLEWYRRNPDDFFLAEVALGAVAGQMNNIDEHGAPSMMYANRLHMEPHILDFDPHSGDFGLGFFGCSIQSASYYIEHKTLGKLCFLCNLNAASSSPSAPLQSAQTAADDVTIRPVDGYRRRVYLEPLALYLTLDVGTFEWLTYNDSKKKIVIKFRAMATDNITYFARRLRVEKLSAARPGTGFKVASFQKMRGAFVIPVNTVTVEVSWI